MLTLCLFSYALASVAVPLLFGAIAYQMGDKS
jgi:hypothetical protein